MKDECLICKAPLEYLESDELMECAICHRKENGKTRCVNGHYVCNACHMAGMDAIIGLCLRETSKNPVEIIEKMMALPFCHMHGPEHHVMVGAALLTAYKNAGGDIDLAAALTEMMNRGKSVPGGACGFWGACGAGISSGMFVSIVSKSTPLAVEPFALSHKMTAKSLGAIGEIGGPRCCKRDSYLSILSAIDFVKEHFGVEMEKPEIVCTHSALNNQCIGKKCPFAKTRQGTVMEGENNMRIAVTYENGQIFQHFGHTEQFKLYDVENGSIVNAQVVDSNGSGHGLLAGFLKEAQVDALICGGIGMGAQMALAEAGIRLYAGVQGSADEAAKALAERRLDYDPDARCDHHEHHDGDCGHDHCAEHHCRGN